MFILLFRVSHGLFIDGNNFGSNKTRFINKFHIFLDIYIYIYIRHIVGSHLNFSSPYPVRRPSFMSCHLILKRITRRMSPVEDELPDNRGALWGYCCLIFCFLCVVFVDYCLSFNTFSLGHCIVDPSSINAF